MKTALLLFFTIISFGTAAATTHNLVWVNDGKSANQKITVYAGDTVKWRWGSGNHNLRSTSGTENFDSSYSSTPGHIFSHTFRQLGATKYQCDPHANNMYGTVTVVSAPEPEPTRVDLSGTIETAISGQGAVIAPVCAIVLASGKFMFSCDPIGQFALDNLPRETDGTVVRQIYADGFFPSVTPLTESGADTITLERAFDCENYNLPSNPDEVPASAGKMHTISGRVLLQATDTPLCALVLVNGQYMFSCGDEKGAYSLKFPLDARGQYTLQVYADGFAPAVQTFNEFDSPSDVRMAKSSECQSSQASPEPIESKSIEIIYNMHKSLPDSYVEELYANFERLFVIIPAQATSDLSQLPVYAWQDSADKPFSSAIGDYGGASLSGNGEATWMVLEIPENEFINNSGHRYSVIAHEYFHVYQISLSSNFSLPSGDPDGFSIMWLAEGAAATFESLYMRQYYDKDYFLEAQTRVDTSVTTNPAKFEVYVRDDNYSSSVFMTLVLAKEMEKKGIPPELGFRKIFREFWESNPSDKNWRDRFAASFDVAVDEFYQALGTYKPDLNTVLPKRNINLQTMLAD